MGNKNIILIIVFSVFACAVHAVMLNTVLNAYAYTSILKFTLFTAFPIIYFVVLKRGKLRELFTIKGQPEKRNLKISFIIGFSVLAFLLIMFVVLYSFLDREMIVGGLEKTGITAENFPFVFVYIIFINAALEEIFFRGFVFLTIYQSGYRKFAYVYSSLLFSVYHVFIMDDWFSPAMFILLLAGLVAAGLIFNELTKRCKSVFGSLIVHVSANLAINLIGVYYFYLH
ncbi:MAG: CPBP family intramembrane metalloprotease [Oscillospiraceae bacterium]|nr:CPBP family intramembrane metalloprotease [Oscillospiraceae bacterium]